MFSKIVQVFDYKFSACSFPRLKLTSMNEQAPTTNFGTRMFVKPSSPTSSWESSDKRRPKMRPAALALDATLLPPLPPPGVENGARAFLGGLGVSSRAVMPAFFNSYG